MMKHIMQSNPQKRYKINEIKKHPWFMKLT